jgi:serine/threonine protein kinase
MTLDSAGDISSGDEFGGYRLEGVAGRGGMGVVYRARHIRLDRVVALKVIDSRFAENREIRARFEQEAQATASLRHPHVVTVFDAGEVSGVLFIAMELIDGTDLGRLLKEQGPMAPRRAVAILVQIAAALDAAHQRGLVHRDVKPENVLITRLGDRDHAYLTDFGLTKVLGGETHGLTSGHDVPLGTLGYLSPEQISGALIDRRADIYALGALLFKTLTDRVPPLESSPTWESALPAAPSLRRVGARRTVAAMQRVVDRAMASDPADRHQTAAEFARHARRDVGSTRRIANMVRDNPFPAVMTLLGLGVMVALTVVARAPTQSPTPTRPSQILSTAAGAVGIPIASPTDVVVDGHTVWVTDRANGAVHSLDTRSGRARRTPIDVRSTPSSIAVRDEVAWTLGRADFRRSMLIRFSTRSGRIARVVRDGPPVIDRLEISDGYLWALSRDTETVTRLDPRTGRQIGAPIRTGRSVTAVGAGFIWAADDFDGDLQRFAIRTGKEVGDEIAIGSGGEVADIDVRGDSAWVARDDSVVRIDTRTGSQVGAPINVGERVEHLDAGEDTVWVAGSSLHRISVASGLLLEPSRALPGNEPSGLSLAAEGDALWVASEFENRVWRIAP